ncbi:DUF4199 domain-containing protein [Flavobacterium sp.]|uniref:DUF4199 domain-containing protein n=1 Tax=Flavobacterium sp. TaxID=239 RepID=UPI00286BA407|nr:DUF4199 domain-containing protein [Flavobacterium sp.]
MNEIIKKNGIAYGIFLGLFSIVVTASIYAIDLALFTNMWVGISTLIIYIIIGVMVVNKTRNQLKTITFKEAFTVFFITAVIGITLSTLFNIILFNLIDPAAKETIQQLTIKYAAEMMQKFGAPAASINEAISKMEETDNFSIGSLIKGMFTSYLVNAVFGLLLAAIFKSRPTEHS